MNNGNLFSKCNIKSYKIEQNSVLINTNGSEKIKIDVCFNNTVRIWADPKGNFEKEKSYAVDKEEWDYNKFFVVDEKEYIKICLSDLVVRVYKENLRIEYYTSDNLTLISGELNNGGMGYKENGQVFLYNKMGENEHFYGLGQDNDAKLGNMDRRGTSRDMVTGQTINKGCVTSDIPVTFFMSTGENNNGYGMFVDNSYRMEFNMGEESEDYYYWKANGGELIYYFIYGPSFKTILDKYTILTGRPSMLPLWALGFIQSKCSYGCWDEYDEIIGKLREKDIPLDCMVFDFDWVEHMHNFKWHPKFEGKSPEKIKQHKENGVKFMVSNSGPMIKKDSSNYEDGLKNNIFATDGKGNTVTCGHYGGDLMDFTAPNIKEWVWKQLRNIYNDGVEGWWLDLTEPEGDPIQTVFQGGSRDKVHNVFSLLNSKTYYEAQKEEHPTIRPFILTRTGTAGIQKYGTAIWTGDVYSDYQTFSAHCPEALNSTMSGISSWTSDSSGFISSTYDSKTETHIHLYRNDYASQGLLYERWLQFACFSPLTRAHHVGPAAPFEYGPLVEAGAKHYLQLRYRLLPYIYSYAYETYRTGVPLMRALVLEYQNDNNVYNIKDEYMFGSNLLVAPVLSENTTSRHVYFPEGKWIDYDYGYEYEGGKTYTVYAPQNRIPVFARLGSIIPMAPIMNYTDEKPWDPITLDIYPNGECEFELYCDDGRTTAFEDKGEFTTTLIKCNEIKNESIYVNINESNKLFTPKSYEFKIHLANKVRGIKFNSKQLEEFYFISKLEGVDEGWYFEKMTNILFVKVKSNKELEYLLEVILDNKEIQRPEAPKMMSNGNALVIEEICNEVAQIPFLLPPASIPCRINAENFDRGGQGVAYNIKSLGNKLGEYRKSEDANIGLTTDIGGGYCVYDLEEKDWLEYTVNVEKSGLYEVTIRVSTEFNNTNSVQVFFNDKDLTGPIYMPYTGGREAWQTVPMNNVFLTKGEQVIKLNVDKGNLNINYIDIKEI